MKSLHAFLGTALAVGATCSCLAQVTYNRQISGVALTSNADGSQTLIGSFTIGATLVPVVKAPEGVGGVLDDVSTVVSVVINGVTFANIPFSIQVDPGTILGGPCGGTCGSGIVNGMSTALFCIDGLCQFPPITANVPIPATVGDVIEVILLPPPGALPDTNTTDDQRTINFDGNQVGWNRAIKNLQVLPSVGGPVTELVQFDVFFDVEYSTFGLLQTTRLGVEPLLLINGIPQPNLVNGCGDWIAAPFDVCQLCTLFLCGTASCGGQNIQLFCRVIENDNNLSACACVGEQSYSFQGISITPADVITVILRPSPGTLPELPPFDDDDTEQYPNGCLTCGGDVNGDGMVDAADLAALLGNWGVCFPI